TQDRVVRCRHRRNSEVRAILPPSWDRGNLTRGPRSGMQSLLESENVMKAAKENLLSRRHFCLCCIGGAAALSGWMTPRQACSEARGRVSLIKDRAATSSIAT